MSKEFGSSARKASRTQKRTKQILGKWPPASAEREEVLEGKDQTKRKSKDISRQGIHDIRQWFETRGQPKGKS